MDFCQDNSTYYYQKKVMLGWVYMTDPLNYLDGLVHCFSHLNDYLEHCLRNPHDFMFDSKAFLEGKGAIVLVLDVFFPEFNFLPKGILPKTVGSKTTACDIKWQLFPTHRTVLKLHADK